MAAVDQPFIGVPQNPHAAIPPLHPVTEVRQDPHDAQSQPPASALPFEDLSDDSDEEETAPRRVRYEKRKTDSKSWKTRVATGVGPKAKRINSCADVPAPPIPSSHDVMTCQFCHAPFQNSDKASIHS
eukprot:5901561-Heterocapsa_arctica.AAC.1